MDGKNCYMKYINVICRGLIWSNYLQKTQQNSMY